MKTSYDEEIDQLEYQRQEIESQLAALRRSRPLEKVQNYSFREGDGQAVSLADLFLDREELIIVHNMGKGCSYCTMWADGFAGLTPHLASRAAFVVSSPDSPADQRAFALKRGWAFRMVSVQEGSFIEDMGFRDPVHGLMPGVSLFVLARDGIYRVARAEFGPGDQFCPVWHFLTLFPRGVDGWSPRLSY